MTRILLFQLIHQPVYQGLLFILFTIALTLIVKPKLADKVWVICGLLYGLFILTNSVLSFWAVDTWPYFFISLGCSLLYLFVIALTANFLIHLLKLKGSGESAMMFLIILLHPLSLLLSIFLKWVLFKMV